MRLDTYNGIRYIPRKLLNRHDPARAYRDQVVQESGN